MSKPVYSPYVREIVTKGREVDFSKWEFADCQVDEKTAEEGRIGTLEWMKENLIANYDCKTADIDYDDDMVYGYDEDGNLLEQWELRVVAN